MSDEINVRKIGFIPGGGIGDMIISLPVLDFLLELFPDCDFDICRTIKSQNYKDIAGPKRLSRIKNVFDQTDGTKYAAVFEANEFLNVTLTKNFYETYPQVMPYYETWQKRMMMMNNTHTIFPRAMNQVGNFAVKMGLDRVTMPQWTFGVTDYKYPKIDHIETEKSSFKYITINDGWNVTGAGFRSTKSWSEYAWTKFIKFARDYGIHVVQLGSTETGREYDVDIQLRGKTTLLESLKLLHGSMCHIDIEGGLVWAATALGTPCVVLHGPTNSKFFGMKQNVNLLHGGCQNCWHMTPSWGRDCLIGSNIGTSDSPLCMRHNPKTVWNSVKKVLKIS